MPRLNTRANAGDDTVPNDPTLYARPVMGRNVGGDLDQSSGGTPWVGGRGSQRLPYNRGNPTSRTGLKPSNPRSRQDAFTGEAMVNRRSMSVQDLDPMQTLDDGITKQKDAWWQHSNQSPLPINFGNWPAAGPVSPTLRLKTFTWRRVPFGRRNTGMHTNIAFSPRTLPGRDKMVARQQNRLTVARFRGQSFSQTTQVLGG